MLCVQEIPDSILSPEVCYPDLLSCFTQ